MSVKRVVSGLLPGGGTPSTQATWSEMSRAIWTSTSGRGVGCDVSSFVEMPPSRPMLSSAWFTPPRARLMLADAAPPATPPAALSCCEPAVAAARRSLLVGRAEEQQGQDLVLRVRRLRAQRDLARLQRADEVGVDGRPVGARRPRRGEHDLRVGRIVDEGDGAVLDL